MARSARIEFTPTSGEFDAVNWHLTKGRLMLMSPLFLAILFVGAVGSGGWQGVVVAIVVAVAAAFTARRFARRLALRQWKRNRALGFKVAFVFDEDGLHASNEVGRIDLPWTDIKYVTANRRFLLVKLRSGLFHYVPLRIFENAQQKDAFLADLKSLGLRFK